MTQGPRPHLKVLNPLEKNPFLNPRRGGTPRSNPSVDRQAHANRLLGELSAAIQQAKKHNAEEGMYLTFQLTPGHNVKDALKSLENLTGRDKVELLHVTPKDTQQGEVIKATVYLPARKEGHFTQKITQFRDEDDHNKPRHEKLVSHLQKITMADLQDLFTGRDFPAWDLPLWWEAWLRKGTLRFFLEDALRLNLPTGPQHLEFLERHVVKVHATALDLLTLLQTSRIKSLAELRLIRHPTVDFLELGYSEKRSLIQDLLTQRLQVEDTNVYLTLLDTGVQHHHPLLAPLMDAHSTFTLYGSEDTTTDAKGHGTKMAGVLAWGDLAEVLTSQETVRVQHRLESVKVLHPQHEVEEAVFFGPMTRDAVNTVEATHPDRNRHFCMAITARESDLDGVPSSWSAEIDQLAYGDGEHTRLFLVSAGNIREPQLVASYPAVNDDHTVEDPAHAWNALTVGAYTERTNIAHPDFQGYRAVAPAGGIAPMSRTSSRWLENRNRPIKPEIVMEGGNHAYPEDADEPTHEANNDLSLLTTSRNTIEPVVCFGDTSAATALAAHLAARASVRYPTYRPETIRGLLVHSAEWTEAMLRDSHPSDGGLQSRYLRLLRRVGYGVPSMDRLLHSTHNQVTLIQEAQLKPLTLVDHKIKTNEINYHRFHWPTEILEELGETAAELRVTLSYFMEPNPGERGWYNRNTYASHRLDFHLRAAESYETFKRRVNNHGQQESESLPNEERWLLGANARLGTVVSDIWRGTAAELARRDAIAVHPVGGWWKEHKGFRRWERNVHYALIVTLKVNTHIDVYEQVQVLNDVEVTQHVEVELEE